MINMPTFRMKNGRFKNIEYHISGELLNRGGKPHNPNSQEAVKNNHQRKVEKRRMFSNMFINNSNKGSR